MSSFYIIPDEQKDFWGSELLNPKQQVEITAAQAHIKAYTDTHKLRGEKEFRLDDTLRRILKTERQYMLLSEVPAQLAYLLPPRPPQKPSAMVGARDRWCPATATENHAYGQFYSVGNSWHGPVWAADCTKCNYHYCDH
jgi:hypothetical protein